MILLLRYLRRHWRITLGVLLFAGANQCFLLLDPLIIRHIIDNVAAQTSGLTFPVFLQRMGFLLACLAVASLGAWFCRNQQLVFLSLVVRRISNDIYCDAIQSSLGMPYSAFEQQRSGEILGKINAARTESERFVIALVNTVFVQLVALVFVGTYAAKVHWSLLPTYLVLAPTVAGMSILLGRQAAGLQKRITEQNALLAGSATESLRNIELVKSLGLSQREVGRIQDRSEAILALETQKIRTIRRLSFFQGLCVQSLRVGLLLLLAYLVYTRQIMVGQFFSVFLYSYNLFGPLQESGNVVNSYLEASAALRNLKGILEAPQETRHTRAVSVGRIESIVLDNVSFCYPQGSAPALTGVSLRAVRGETIGLAGPSGSGKSTIIKLLAALYEPTSGTVTFNGVPSTTINWDRLRARMGVITQDVQLFSGSIRENLIFSRPEATDADCVAALKAASADDLLSRAPKGLDTLIGESGMRLSGGERQRLSIARALLRRPEILLLDEATSSLDSLSEAEIVDMIDRVDRSQDRITIVIAHRLSTLLRADRIYVLDQGRVVESGSHAELVEANGVYQRMWVQQPNGTSPGSHSSRGHLEPRVY